MQILIAPYYFSQTKRAFDIFFSASVLFFLSPFFLSIAGLLWFSQGRPIFFIQNRVGQDRRVFRLIKFRTMYVGAERQQTQLQPQSHAPKPMFKVVNDPRYTKIGHFLARFGLDELPQFWNILKGEMSVVGPRPLPVREAKKLPKNWNFRYQVKPGLISEWAISPQRYHSLKTWHKLEKGTLKKGSVNSDLQLIIKTFVFLFRFF